MRDLGRNWSWLIPAALAIVTSLITSYSLLQTHETRITRVEKDLDHHEALAGHAGISERIQWIREQLEEHETNDTALYTTGFGGRITTLEARMLEVERKLPQAKTPAIQSHVADESLAREQKR